MPDPKNSPAPRHRRPVRPIRRRIRSWLGRGRDPEDPDQACPSCKCSAAYHDIGIHAPGACRDTEPGQ